MCFTFKRECPDCQKYMRTGDFFHDKETWDSYHNSGWINGKSDWQPREEIQDMLDRMKRIWKRTMIITNKTPTEVDIKIMKSIIKFSEND